VFQSYSAVILYLLNGDVKKTWLWGDFESAPWHSDMPAGFVGRLARFLKSVLHGSLLFRYDLIFLHRTRITADAVTTSEKRMKIAPP
jgi:hypothetical protein